MFRTQITAIEMLSSISDTSIAIAASIALFMIPSGKKNQSLLEWKDTHRLPWDILLLFGGDIPCKRLRGNTGSWCFR